MKKGKYLVRTTKGLLEENGMFENYKDNSYFIYKNEYGTWFLVDTNSGVALDTKYTKKGLLENLFKTNDSFETYKLNMNYAYVNMIKGYNKLKEERK